MTIIEKMGARAKKAARELAVCTAKRETALKMAAQALLDSSDEILAANEKDISLAKKNNMPASFIDRLSLNHSRIESMSSAILEVAAENNPIGRIIEEVVRPNGLKIEKISVPLGVIGIIFEARPNVTSDAAALCIKAGNAVILRGGKEAYNSNRAITDILAKAFKSAGLPDNSIQLIDDLSRESAAEMMNLTDYLDVLIPRGGAGLINFVKQNSKVPIIETGVGNCHVYVDEFADVDMAASIIFNAKTSRPSVCNSIETVLVHEKIAKIALPKIKARLDEKQVEIRACEKTARIISGTISAVESDWLEEFLSYTVAVKVVEDIDEAINHIAKYSSGHSEAIITENSDNSEKFVAAVDSAAVYVNASTRFTDGGEFGLGAEIGISTQKLHARGPMGLRELTSYKYIIHGNGQIR